MAADAGGITAALPRSLLHLRFLVDNGATPDIVLVRDGFMAAPVEAAYPGRAVALGRETLPSHSLRGLLAARRANRAYYAQVAETIARRRVARLILFLEGEPLERWLAAQPGIAAVELWEDGLSHYVDLTSGAWYAARGLVQAAAGFHPHRITRRRMDRRIATVRDRFERGNLRLAPPHAPAERRDALLLVGSPLVEDRLVTRPRALAAIAAIAGAAPCPVRYLPHPREDKARLAADLAAIPNLLLEPNPAGLLVHAGQYGYRGYVAAVSTGLLDLGRFERSLFVPALFGLSRTARVIAAWPANPVRSVAAAGDLAAALAALPPLNEV